MKCQPGLRALRRLEVVECQGGGLRLAQEVRRQHPLAHRARDAVVRVLRAGLVQLGGVQVVAEGVDRKVPAAKS